MTDMKRLTDVVTDLAHPSGELPRLQKRPRGFANLDVAHKRKRAGASFFFSYFDVNTIRGSYSIASARPRHVSLHTILVEQIATSGTVSLCADNLRVVEVDSIVLQIAL